MKLRDIAFSERSKTHTEYLIHDVTGVNSGAHNTHLWRNKAGTGVASMVQGVGRCLENPHSGSGWLDSNVLYP